MAVRQYIGAKYVPHGWTDWNAQTLYDPLYIVKYNLGWYILKKPLPQAGVLPTNEEYWALVDNWNGQVEEYRQEVEEVKEQITSLEKELTEKYYLFVGDSYNAPGRWGSKVANILGLTADQYTSVYKGGIGFIPHADDPDKDTFLTIAKAVPAAILNKVTHIVLISAGNDAPSSNTGVSAGMVEVYNGILSLCPNVQLFYVGMCVYRRNPQNYTWHYDYCSLAEKNILPKMVYLTSSPYFMHINENILADGTHLTDYGYGEIAKGIVAGLNGHQYESKTTSYYQYFSVNEKVQTLGSRLENGLISIDVGGSLEFSGNMVDNMYTFTPTTQSYLTGAPMEFPVIMYSGDDVAYGSYRVVNGNIRIVSNRQLSGVWNYTGHATFPATVV